jgi:hypothetical protein
VVIPDFLTLPILLHSFPNILNASLLYMDYKGKVCGENKEIGQQIKSEDVFV